MRWSEAPRLESLTRALSCIALLGIAVFAHSELADAQDDTRPPIEVVDAFFPERACPFLPARGAWLPLYVELRSTSEQTESVLLRASVSRAAGDEDKSNSLVSESRVEVPPGQAPRRAWLYVRVRPQELDFQSVRLELVVRGRTMPLSMFGTAGNVVVSADSQGVLPMWIVGGDRDEVAPWPQTRRRTGAKKAIGDHLSSEAVERLELHELPDASIGYQAIGAVILRGLDEARLEEAQVEALLRWVSSGGLVILAPTGNEDAIFRSDLALRLLGLEAEATRYEGFQPEFLVGLSGSHLHRRGTPVLEALQKNLPPPLAREETFDLFEPIPPGTPVRRAIVSVADLETESLVQAIKSDWKSSDRVVYTERAIGQGRVGCLGLDDQLHGHRGAVGDLRATLWGTILSRGSLPARSSASSRAAELVNSPLSSVFSDSDREIGTLFIGGLIVVYLLIVGPGVYFFLKRRRRLPAILWVEPLVILAYLGVIYGVGYFTKGFLTQAERFTLIHQSPGAPFALRESYLSLFSAADTTYDVECPAGDWVLPIFANAAERDGREVHLVRELGARSGASDATAGGVALRDYRLNLWQHAAFRNVGWQDLGGDVEIDGLEAGVAGTGPDLRITNGLPWPITGGRVAVDQRGVLSDGALELPPIACGESVVLDGSRRVEVPEPDSRRARELEILEVVLSQGVCAGSTPRLVAWVDRGEQEDIRLGQSASVSRSDLYVLEDRAAGEGSR